MILVQTSRVQPASCRRSSSFRRIFFHILQVNETERWCVDADRRVLGTPGAQQTLRSERHRDAAPEFRRRGRARTSEGVPRASAPASGSARAHVCVCKCVCVSFNETQHPSSRSHRKQVWLYLKAWPGKETQTTVCSNISRAAADYYEFYYCLSSDMFSKAAHQKIYTFVRSWWTNISYQSSYPSIEGTARWSDGFRYPFKETQFFKI